MFIASVEARFEVKIDRDVINTIGVKNQRDLRAWSNKKIPFANKHTTNAMHYAFVNELFFRKPGTQSGGILSPRGRILRQT